MTGTPENELRWLVGKIVHCAAYAGTIAEFEEWLADVAIPVEFDLVLDGDPHVDTVHRASRAAFVAACHLYGHGSEGEHRAHAQIRQAFGRLSEMEAGVAQPEGPSPTDAAEESSAEPTPETGGGDANASLQRARQDVVVGRDVNAPIVNAPGGSVTINDRSSEVDRELHDYLTYLVYVAFGIKRLNAAQEVRGVLEEAMASLVRYHDRTGRLQVAELRDDAPGVRDKVDAACRAVFGMSFEDARPQLFTTDFPTFPLFENMILIRGGRDPFTASEVAPFYLARHPVTVGQYAEFCRSTGWPPVPEWGAMKPPDELSDHPVTGVTLFDTVVYCSWLEAATGFRFRVATESEWCLAAAGGRRQRYPWGDSYIPGRATTQHESPHGTRPVDACPDGATPEGILDLVGNVWELTSTLHVEDPEAQGNNFTFPPVLRALMMPKWWETDSRMPKGAGPWQEAGRFVMRGGSWGGGPEWATVDQRIWTSAFNRGAYGGFRIACSAEPIGSGYVPSPSYLSPRLATFVDRVSLRGEDAVGALTEKQFSVCGSGSVWTGQLRGDLLKSTLGRYDTLDDQPIPTAVIVVGDRGAHVANTTHFPRLAVKTADGLAPHAEATPPAAALDVPALLTAATEQARRRNHGRVDARHLLLSVLENQRWSVAVALVSLNVTETAVTDLFEGDDSLDGKHPEPLVDEATRAIFEAAGGSFLGLDAVNRLLSDPPGEVAALLQGIEPEDFNTTLSYAQAGQKLLHATAQGVDPETLERIIATYERLLPHNHREALPVLATARTALALVLDDHKVPPEQTSAAQLRARETREALATLEGHYDDRNLQRLLLAQVSNLEDAERIEDAISVLNEATVIGAWRRQVGHDPEHFRLAGRRGLLLARAGRAADGLPELEDAIGHLTDGARGMDTTGASDSGWISALAYTHGAHAESLGAADEHARALVASFRALQVALPVASRHIRPVPATYFDLQTLRATYIRSCERDGGEPDAATLARLAIALGQGPTLEEEIEARATSDREDAYAHLPRTAPVPLVRLTGSSTTCSICEQDEATVGGLMGRICPSCVDLTGEVLARRADQADTETHGQYRPPCSICGWSCERREVVSGGHGSICLECQRRCEALLKTLR